MESIYAKIKTAKELLYEVSAHGFSTRMEDVCRAQDIFGHTTIDELDALANDNGMDGTWSTGRRGTQAVFYQVLFDIWSWEDATRFYNQHTNPEYKALKEAGKKLDDEIRAHQETKHAFQQEIQATKEQQQAVLEERVKVADYAKQVAALKAESHSLRMQVMELKAKLYDLLIKPAEKNGEENG